MYNLLDECSLYKVNLQNISNELRVKLSENYSLDGTESIGFIYLSDIKKLNIPENETEFYMFDEYMLENILINALDDFPHYLVFASRCKWNGESGYEFCDNIVDTCYRDDYDVNIAVQAEVANKALVCLESSHDRPTGSHTIIVGLTEDEYEKLSEANFNEIEQYVNQFDK